VEKLKAVDIPDASGEADLVSKKDLQIELAPIRADINLIKWMLGILLGGVLTLILKAFFSTLVY
ncbi:MAG: DUF1640 domain-containing protein, partial [Methylobacter sp.]|nr:DUF1640 domain-containing protein [Methylobacter sp.]